MTPSVDKPVPFVSLSGAALQKLEDHFAAPIDALATPWPLWNDACHGIGGRKGIALGWHVLVAGASGGAKTFTALNLARAAVEQRRTVALYSLEMDWTEVGARWLPLVSEEPAWRLEPGPMFSREHFRAARDEVNCHEADLIMNQQPIRTLDQIVTAVRRNADAGIKIHIIDYLQLAWVRDADSMFQRITEVSHEVRALAKELKLVTIGLSQLNRAGNTEESPRKESMAGSSSLENDADQVVLLDHTKRKPVVNPFGKPIGWFGWAELAKNRHGPQARIPIAFNSDTFRIRQRNDDEIDADEMPKRGAR
jgi:replicative DNA helicase